MAPGQDDHPFALNLAKYLLCGMPSLMEVIYCFSNDLSILHAPNLDARVDI
jgi:hypothetical protein